MDTRAIARIGVSTHGLRSYEGGGAQGSRSKLDLLASLLWVKEHGSGT